MFEQTNYKQPQKHLVIAVMIVIARTGITPLSSPEAAGGRAMPKIN